MNVDGGIDNEGVGDGRSPGVKKRKQRGKLSTRFVESLRYQRCFCVVIIGHLLSLLSRPQYLQFKDLAPII